MKKLRCFCVFLSILFLVLTSFSCKKNKPDDGDKPVIKDGITYDKKIPDDDFYYDDGISANDKYNPDLYYRNDALIMPFADPSGIYITEGEDEGYYYAYGTSGNLGNGFLSYKTKDFSHWIANGPAYLVETASWGISNFWAPEVIYNATQKLYYLYFNALSKIGVPNSSSTYDSFYLGICVSENPAGPFQDYRKYFGEKNQEEYDISQPPVDFTKHFYEMGIDSSSFTCQSWAAIDFSPFIDDNGDLYLYFVKHVDTNTFDNSLWGIKMIDFVTPNYSTVKKLANARYSYIDENGNVDENDLLLTEGNVVNEGPFMITHTTKKNDGSLVKKYYLTYSAFGYSNRAYRVNVAVSDNPLGPFRKLTDYAPMHGIDTAWNYVSGTGHHSFMYSGDDIYILYHAHYDRVNGGGNPRYIAVDRIFWKYDDSLGYDVLHSNGPSWNLNPLPTSYTGLKNIAVEAEISDSINGKTKFLTDEIIPLHPYDNKLTYVFEKQNKIVLDFNREREIAQIFVYNGNSVSEAFKQIDSIILYTSEKTYCIKDIDFNKSYYDLTSQIIFAGAPAVVSFNNIKVNKVEINISKPLEVQGKCAIGDIFIMGK